MKDASEDFVGEGLVRSFEEGEDKGVFFLPAPTISFASWSPSIRKGGPQTQVHMLLHTKEGGETMSMVVRLKSRRICEEILAALKTHMDDVWPASSPGIIKDLAND